MTEDEINLEKRQRLARAEEVRKDISERPARMEEWARLYPPFPSLEDRLKYIEACGQNKTASEAKVNHPAETLEKQKARRAAGKFIVVLLKWLLYAAITFWAVSERGWVGLFVIPIAFACFKFVAAITNWVEYWSKQKGGGA